MRQGYKLARLSVTLLMITAAFGAIIPHGFAQEAPPSNSDPKTQVFDPDYFTQFAPQTAADMVARLPGFNIRGGEGGGRGFGQATLNILINGRRPSSKSSGANEILSRIPASNVSHIEIIDGSTLDIPGLSGQVANITAKSGDLSGSWNYAARFEEGSKPQLADGSINFSAKRGRLEAVGSLGVDQFSFTEDGDETFFDGADTVIQNRDEKLGFKLDRPNANLNLTWLRDNGDIANFNVSGSRDNRNVTVQETFEDVTNDALSGQSVAENGEDQDIYEFSGDYSFDAPFIGSEGRLKIIGLNRNEDFFASSRFVFETEADGQIRQQFLRDDSATEYIGRAEYTWKTGDTNDWSLAVEGAFNTLDSDTELTEDGVVSPLENVRIEEDRFQTALTRSWSVNDELTAQVSLGAEYSEIGSIASTGSVVTDERSDTFFRPTGFGNLSYKFKKNWTLRAEVERRVRQLDFGAFVSDVSFASGTADSGGRLIPEQNWNSNIEIEHQNNTGLSGRIRLFYNIVEDPIVQQVFEDETDENGTAEIIQGLANLDSNATFYGIRGNFTWVLDDVLKGLRLSGEGRIRDSSIRDVITDENRSRSGRGLWDFEIEGRWDIDGTPYALETEIEHSRRADRFRIDERTDDVLVRPEIEFSVIHKNFLGMQWTAKVQNIANFELRRDRFIFDETRNGDLLQRELTRRTRGQRFSIEVTDTF